MDALHFACNTKICDLLLLLSRASSFQNQKRLACLVAFNFTLKNSDGLDWESPQKKTVVSC